MSKTESIPVARSERDREEIAAYTKSKVSEEHQYGEHDGILTLKNAEGDIRE